MANRDNLFTDITSGLKSLFGWPWGTERTGSLMSGGRGSARTPDHLRAVPPFLPGQPSETGHAILLGHWSFGGERIDCRLEEFPFGHTPPSPEFADWLNSFDWLADAVAACETDRQSSRMLRDWVDSWIAHHGRYDMHSWQPGLIARRVMNWLNFADILFGDQAPGRVGRLDSLARQARRLDLNLNKSGEGMDHLLSGLGLAALGAVLPQGDRMVESGLSVLNEELNVQVFADGGHIDRRPETLIELMILLRQLKGLFAHINRPAPSAMQRAMDRIAPMIRYLLTQDGHLVSFHGGSRGRKAEIEYALAQHAPPPRLFRIAPQTGFQRVATDAGVLIMDTMGPPDTLEGHASPLAFEFSTPGGPLLVNCGWMRGALSALRNPVRATAAHTALIVEDTNAMPLWVEDPRHGGRYRRPLAGATARRTEDEAGIWLDASHDGYRAAHGLVHRRRIFVTHEGDDLRGEDTLFAPLDTKELQTSQKFDVRFHLHPSVTVRVSEDGRSALLTRDDGESWRFRTDLAPIQAEASLYLGESQTPAATRQLVLSGQTRPDLPPERSPNRVRWTLKRV
jgi:uncharacterized heparinase superfamily protein